ncbi:MAG TPA: hypothetical protein VFA47_05065, partial [Candidatus Manganitrophaceae bacterium]|nr:hypothetical protein [Candidatus Manganitrophaceae bacterium]
MKVAIPKEILPGENRVAATPETVDKMVKGGLEVVVESNAGQGANITNADYEKVGAKIAPDAAAALQNADLVLKIQRPLMNEKTGRDETELMKEGAIVIALLQPLSHPDVARKLAERKLTAFAM